MSTAIISHSKCMLHEMGAGHPEQPARLKAIQDQLVLSGLDRKLHFYTATEANQSQLKQVHDPAYVDHIYKKSPSQGVYSLDMDTLMNPYSLEAALLAAGALIDAVDLVMSGKHKRVFCSVRPPGHHAEKDRAMGFCIFNNIAIGVMHALTEYELQRVAIIDFDVHHGNGTEDIFYQDPRVLFCSSFQHPFYPFKGDQTASPHIINIPLAAESTAEDFRRKVAEQWLPQLHKFKPQLIFISAGFDAHAEDYMSNLRLMESDYRWITREIKTIAEKHAQGRIVSSLEGGYNLDALARSVQAHIEELL